MKKVLFATTALVATAGVASADIALSGSAEMGYQGGDGVAESFFTDIDVTFTMSGETDNGLTFGAAVDLDEAAGAATTNNADDGGIAIFLSGDFGTVTLGDTDGAMDWALTEAVGNPGSIADDETSHAGYRGGNYVDGFYDGQILRYDNTFGDFGVAVSVETDDANVRGVGFGIGGRYTFEFAGGSVAVGIAYQQAEADGAGANSTIGGLLYAAGEEVQVFAISGAATLDSGFTAGVTYADINAGASGDSEHIQLSAGYSFDAFAVGVNYGDYSGAATNSGWGFAASYDLGGGASAHFGYGRGETPGTVETYSLGIAMSF